MDWAGLAGSAAQVVGTLAAQSSQNAANYDLNYENKAWQLKMMQYQNRYNSPLQQRKRLEQAGINPALAMQDSNPNMAASNPNLPNQIPMDYSQLGSGLSSAVANYLQSEQVHSQNELLKSQTEAYRIDNLTRNAKNLVELQKVKSEMEKNNEDTKYINWMIDRSMALFDADQKKAYSDIRLQNSQTAYNEMAELTGYNTDSREWQLLEPTIKQIYSAVLSNQSLSELQRIQANNLPKLSNSQREQLADAVVEKALHDASEEQVLGFSFKGSTMGKIKNAIINILTGN